MQDLVTDQGVAPLLRQYQTGKQLTNLLDDKIESAILNLKHNGIVEMITGSDQQNMKKGEVIPLFCKRYVILRMDLTKLLNMAPTFKLGQWWVWKNIQRTLQMEKHLTRTIDATQMKPAALLQRGNFQVFYVWDEQFRALRNAQARSEELQNTTDTGHMCSHYSYLSHTRQSFSETVWFDKISMADVAEERYWE